ncbi:HAMP domain-containing sensor histidine kinase [Cryobacterium sp. PH29-G1]|uniref:sensor histidine kinase n=1 Tax=Cryobacterium sp. PH29-G1 TaxID=3046211 RepID=UPI0024BA4C6C|nr:HAMP domain-containing sensor histidine kinase [Cryobacterium sp. PH29-G1]MDJ0350643.1 HAMP domain-containing sensor histidine kinase [Cryobacterium sp. PH29-G1]
MARHYEGYARSLAEFQVVVFIASAVVDTALVLARPHNLDPLLYGLGAAMIVLATIATLIWRHNVLFQKFSLLLPLVDIVGIRLTALSDDTMLSGAGLVLMLPIIWIAYSFGPWGFVACLALVAATSPRSFLIGYANFDANDFTRLVAFPLTMIIMAMAAGVSGTRIRRKRAELAVQTALTEKAVRARDDLIDAVTHELRTPLTSILGNAELMQRTSEQPQAVERRAGVIVRNAEQMETILADLLLARSTGTVQLSLQCTATDLRALIENCLAASRAAADAHGVSVEVHASAELWAEVDPHRIRQVLDNLLTNAIKYNRVGGTVTVSETHSAQRVTLAITDTGAGIADAERMRVFEPYYRTESALHSSQGGTGLGLGISRDIAQRHGGDLLLVDSSAAGSRFELTLPLTPTPAVARTASGAA